MLFHFPVVGRSCDGLRLRERVEMRVVLATERLANHRPVLADVAPFVRVLAQVVEYFVAISPDVLPPGAPERDRAVVFDPSDRVIARPPGRVGVLVPGVRPDYVREVRRRKRFFDRL